MGSVVAILRAKDSPAGHLHVQSLYPSETVLGVGHSSAEVSVKEAADYAGPTTMNFS